MRDVPTVAAVRDAIGQHALDLLDADPAAAGSPEGLELRASAAYGAGDFEGAVAAWERLHALLLAVGDRVGAARAAAMIAMYLMMDTGLMAPVCGWLRRAERLLDGETDGPAHALIAMTATYERFMCGDMDSARTCAAQAIELGERHGVEPAAVIGRVASARVRILDGDLAGGLDQLDARARSPGSARCHVSCRARSPTASRSATATTWTTRSLPQA